MDNTLSASLPKPHMDQRKMSDMWEEAGNVPALKAIDDDLTEWSDAATEQNRRGCEAARSFYRGTSIKEALDVASRGGGISKDGRFDFMSLSTSLGAALTFGRKNKIQVVLEYDGDSIRRTGEAAPVEYSHGHSSLDQARGRGMPLKHHLEQETRIPDETKGPILERVLLSADRMFGRDLKK